MRNELAGRDQEEMPINPELLHAVIYLRPQAADQLSRSARLR